MFSHQTPSASCACAGCTGGAAPSVQRRKLGLALAAGLLAGLATRRAAASSDLLDPSKIGVPKKPVTTSTDLLLPGKSTQPRDSAAAIPAARPPRGERRAPSYARGMAASVVSSFDGFTQAIARLAAKRKSLMEKEKKAAAELAQLKAEYADKMEEYRQGLFCSGCGNTRSEILRRGETFPHSGQTIVRPTAEQIAAKERQLQGPIDRLERELKQIAEDKQKLEDEIYQARMQVEAGLRLWRTALSFEVNLMWADEVDLRAAFGAERTQASDQRDKLIADAKKAKDGEAREAIARDMAMWDAILRRLDTRRDGELRTFQSNLKQASSTSFRERDRLDYFLKREGVSDVTPTIVSMAIQYPSGSFDFLGGNYRMGDFQPSNKDQILSSVRSFITAFVATPQGNCTVLNASAACINAT